MSGADEGPEVVPPVHDRNIVTTLPEAMQVSTLQSHCQVEGCGADLSGLKDYHQRYKICDVHLKMQSVTVEGAAQRFCQQCGRFHLLEAFDNTKRSCRARLQKHNERRRRKVKEANNKQATDPADPNDPNFSLTAVLLGAEGLHDGFSKRVKADVDGGYFSDSWTGSSYNGSSWDSHSSLGSYFGDGLLLGPSGNSSPVPPGTLPHLIHPNATPMLGKLPRSKSAGGYVQSTLGLSATSALGAAAPSGTVGAHAAVQQISPDYASPVLGGPKSYGSSMQSQPNSSSPGGGHCLPQLHLPDKIAQAAAAAGLRPVASQYASYPASKPAGSRLRDSHVTFQEPMQVAARTYSGSNLGHGPDIFGSQIHRQINNSNLGPLPREPAGMSTSRQDMPAGGTQPSGAPFLFRAGPAEACSRLVGDGATLTSQRASNQQGTGHDQGYMAVSQDSVMAKAEEGHDGNFLAPRLSASSSDLGAGAAARQGREMKQMICAMRQQELELEQQRISLEEERLLIMQQKMEWGPEAGGGLREGHQPQQANHNLMGPPGSGAGPATALSSPPLVSHNSTGPTPASAATRMAPSLGQPMQGAAEASIHANVAMHGALQVDGNSMQGGAVAGAFQARGQTHSPELAPSITSSSRDGIQQQPSGLTTRASIQQMQSCPGTPPQHPGGLYLSSTANRHGSGGIQPTSPGQAVASGQYMAMPHQVWSEAAYQGLSPQLIGQYTETGPQQGWEQAQAIAMRLSQPRSLRYQQDDPGRQYQGTPVRQLDDGGGVYECSHASNTWMQQSSAVQHHGENQSAQPGLFFDRNSMGGGYMG